MCKLPDAVIAPASRGLVGSLAASTFRQSRGSRRRSFLVRYILGEREYGGRILLTKLIGALCYAVWNALGTGGKLGYLTFILRDGSLAGVCSEGCFVNSNGLAFSSSIRQRPAGLHCAV